MHRNSILAIAFAAIAAAAGLLVQPASLAGGQTSRLELDKPQAKSQTMIAMRDGVRLNTEIYAPKSISEPLPIILLRTPYGIATAPRNFLGYFKELAEDGYIFAFQDIRGRFKSEGQFVMDRPMREKSDPKAIDESTDTYDTIEWLIKNVPKNNGRVGMLGISYDGFLTACAILDPHPALKAASPQASPADMFIGDDFYHNGAFRLSYGFEYVAMMETSNVVTQFHFDRYDTYDWYLSLGALSHANEKYFNGKLPTWNDFTTHASYDSFWQNHAFAAKLDKLTVPTLNVAGWWDQEDFYGALKIYEELEKKDPDHKNYLAAGPWNHGGWAGGDGATLGRINFESNTSKYFREKIQAPWFAYFLKDKGKFEQLEATTFQTGSNKWMSYDRWPPKNMTVKNLYFHGGRRLSFEAPDAGDANESDSYVSDPAKPVPYRPRPIEPTYYPGGSGWYTWLLEDQRFVDHRPDVLSWETEPLDRDVVVSGDIVAHLFASTSGSDSDWVVKLIDVYPEVYSKAPKMAGYELMIANDVFRGRFRKSYEKPEPITPNHPDEYRIDLHSNDHTFLKGHRIMVQVQSTWFPLIDRNPQKYVENIFRAKDSDYQKAAQRVYRSKQHSSHIALPVVAQ